MDKIETIIQHYQGDNPNDFDYEFNINYGKEYSQFEPKIQSNWELVDRETLKKELKEANLK